MYDFVVARIRVGGEEEVRFKKVYINRIVKEDVAEGDRLPDEVGIMLDYKGKPLNRCVLGIAGEDIEKGDLIQVDLMKDSNQLIWKADTEMIDVTPEPTGAGSQEDEAPGCNPGEVDDLHSGSNPLLPTNKKLLKGE